LPTLIVHPGEMETVLEPSAAANREEYNNSLAAVVVTFPVEIDVTDGRIP
jgi:hypothetical protein